MNIVHSLFTAALSLAALTSSAQETIHAITVKLPKATRMAKVHTEGVNLRRLPNSTSGKIMVWNSDAGSYDTYTKLFYSDTEASRYRANRNTGAYVDTYHPQSGDFLMVNPNQSEPKNGWYQVMVSAEEYAGNPGRANSKYGWIKADFCKIIDVAESEPQKLANIEIPITFSNPNNPEEEYSSKVSLVKGLQHRTKGQYNNFSYMIAAHWIDAIKIIHAQIEGNFLFYTETYASIEYDPDQSTPIKVEKIEEENEIGDIDETLKITLKGKRSKDTFYTIYDNFAKISDNDFSIIVSTIAPDGKLPTDCVYFFGTDGNTYSFGYNSNTLPNGTYIPCTLPLHTIK